MSVFVLNIRSTAKVILRREEQTTFVAFGALRVNCVIFRGIFYMVYVYLCTSSAYEYHSHYIILVSAFLPTVEMIIRWLLQLLLFSRKYLS